MRGIALVVLVVSCFCASLVYIPANIFIPEDHYLTTKRFAMIDRVRGTIWNGQVLLRTRDKEIQLLVNWKIRGRCFFGLKLCSQIQMKTAAPRGKSSELYFNLDVPISSLIFSSGCAPLSSFKISESSGLLSSQLLWVLIPELVDAEQNISLRNIALEFDFKEGVLSHASGQIDIEAGSVRYVAPNGAVKSQHVEELHGQFSKPAGYELILEDKGGSPYLGILTDESQERLRFVVYDSFARIFGAAVMNTAATDVPRFEISQKLSDMLCESP